MRGECSISRVLFRQAVAIIYLFLRLLARYSDTTRKVQRAASSLPYLVLLRMGFTKPSNYLPCWCALTAPFHPYQINLAVHFSVALSLRFPSPDVIRHSALWSSDFPHRLQIRKFTGAAIAFHTHVCIVAQGNILVKTVWIISKFRQSFATKPDSQTILKRIIAVYQMIHFTIR